MTTELRRDPFTGRRVWFVPGRSGRPSDWIPKGDAAPKDAKDCPFCPGHEDQTPPEIWALRDDPHDVTSWRIRVIPNKYPISGAHELILETPKHGADLADLPQTQLAEIITVYRDRMAAHAGEGRWRYLSLFKNHGWPAGASRAHPHAQLVGLPFVPPLVRLELQRARRAYRRRNRCLYCETIEREIRLKDRVIELDERFVVWSPYAARMSLECWLLPRRHAADFLAIESEEILSLARLLGRTLRRLKTLLPPRAYAYNFYVHTLPVSSARAHPEQAESYHWHIEIVPRLGRLAGLEWGTGLYLNPLFPEEAARMLREAL
jgi:UDPglucose--hexose-1-phosphate uridylyltransferase